MPGVLLFFSIITTMIVIKHKVGRIITRSDSTGSTYLLQIMH